MNLYGIRDLQDEQRNSVYYKTVMYMLRYQSKLGMIFYPSKSEDVNAKDESKAKTQDIKTKENVKGSKNPTNNESSNSIDIKNNNKTKANVARWSIESDDNSCNDKARSFHLISLNLNCLTDKNAVFDELSEAEDSFKRAVKESIESLNKILENTGKSTG